MECAYCGKTVYKGKHGETYGGDFCKCPQPISPKTMEFYNVLERAGIVKELDCQSCRAKIEAELCKNWAIHKTFEAALVKCEAETKQKCWEDLATEVLLGNFVIPVFNGALPLRIKWGLLQPECKDCSISGECENIDYKSTDCKELLDRNGFEVVK